jgi:pimeloyl-ACP methyl ester carboxylesterase
VAPHIRYVTTGDGVRIAWSARGRGPIVVSMPPLPCRHIELEWQQSAEEVRFLEALGAGRTLVQYDPRGLGLSDRTAPSYDLDALVRDLDAVVAELAPERVALFAGVNAGPTAIAYAARRPERVSHLILWCSSPRGAEGIGPQFDAIVGLLEHDWTLASETLAHLLRGWSASDQARRLAALLRAAVTPDVARTFVIGARAADVSDLLGRVQAQTLVLHRRGVTWVPIERAVDLAAGIPGARLTVFEGDSMAPWVDDTDAVVRVIDEFLGGAPLAHATAAAPAADDGDTFRCEGDYWTLAFGGRVCRLRDAKGLHHLAHLLARPGEPIAAAELMVALDGTGRAEGGDAGPVLDAQARSTYRRRLADLEEELSDAERCNDDGRRSAARAEMEFLATELARAIGLGGRDRRAASVSERVRLTVTKRIRDALARIARRHAPLGAYLSRTIRTGTLCAYVPDSDRPPRWSF